MKIRDQRQLTLPVLPRHVEGVKRVFRLERLDVHLPHVLKLGLGNLAVQSFALLQREIARTEYKAGSPSDTRQRASTVPTKIRPQKLRTKSTTSSLAIKKQGEQQAHFRLSEFDTEYINQQPSPDD